MKLIKIKRTLVDIEEDFWINADNICNIYPTKDKGVDVFMSNGSNFHLSQPEWQELHKNLFKPSITKPTKPSNKIDSRVEEIITYFNILANKNFNPKTYQPQLLTILKTHSVAQVKEVIDHLHVVWGGDKDMSKYFVPASLFRAGKFDEKYDNAINNSKASTPISSGNVC